MPFRVIFIMFTYKTKNQWGPKEDVFLRGQRATESRLEILWALDRGPARFHLVQPLYERIPKRRRNI